MESHGHGSRWSTLPTLAMLWITASFIPSAAGQQESYPVASRANLTTDANCTCFRTNTSTSNYFSHHIFSDFRSLTEHIHVPKVLSDRDSNADAPPTNAFFGSSAFTDIWAAQNWDNGALMSMNDSDVSGTDATLFMVNSPNNIYIERNNDTDADSSTFMTMRTARLAHFQTAAEIESASSGFQFLSIRMYARTLGDPGAITAMFTYREDNGSKVAEVQESDLEIRTSDPQTRVQLTNQPSWDDDGDIPAATRNVSLPDGHRWSEWATYRIDWTSGSTTWFINGQLSATITFQAPRDPSQITFNSWSDGGSWSGSMSKNAEAFLQIQWIDMVFNNTDAQYTPPAGGCTYICSIDETPEIGTPVLIANATIDDSSGTSLLSPFASVMAWASVGLLTVWLHGM